MRYLRPHRTRVFAFDEVYQFGEYDLCTIARDKGEVTWWMYSDKDLRWCNLYGFDIRNGSHRNKILGDE